MTAVAPQSQAMGVAVGGLSSILANEQEIHIAQSINIADAIGKNCCSCCNDKNRYTGFSGNPHLIGGFVPGANPTGLFYAIEESHCMERICCNGNHTLSMFIFNNQGQVLNTIYRPGCSKGKCCMPMPACAGLCQQEMHVYEGGIPFGSEDFVNRPPLFTARERPCFASPCNLKIGIHGAADPEPSMIISGPCCFGGCKSLCFNDHFPITEGADAPVGHLMKKSPDSCGSCIKEICTDADDFQVNFAANATPDQKLAMVTGAFMADIMLFEKDKGPFFCENWKACDCACTLWNCYVCGRFTPCIVRSKWLRKYYFCPCALFPGCQWCNFIPCCNQFN
jgi:hypothetical protein